MQPKIIIPAVVILIAAFSFWFYSRHPLSGTVTINNTVFIVDLAVTSIEKEKGLGYRKTLPEKHGMLFVYDHKAIFPFWMKGMQFPLDFVWIYGNQVMDITRNVQPPEGLDLHVVKPQIEVDKILELNAGDVDKYGIKVGDMVRFNK